MKKKKAKLVIPGSSIKDVIENCDHGLDVVITSPLNIDELVDRLVFVNFNQWKLEDAIRNDSITSDEALVLIRRIQSSNSERNHLIEMIDKIFFKNEIVKASQSKLGKVYHETLGQMIDILSVLYIRKFHLIKMTKSGMISYGHGFSMRDSITAVDQQIVLCEKSFLLLLKLYLSGRITLPPFTKFKLYAFSESTPLNTSAKGEKP